MKTHYYRDQQDEDTAEEQIVTEQKPRENSAINEPLSKAAHDWNHALEIATDRMWGEQVPLLRIVPRDKKD